MDQRQRHDSHSIEATADAHTIASAASPRAWSVSMPPRFSKDDHDDQEWPGERRKYVCVFFREKPPEDFLLIGSVLVKSCRVYTLLLSISYKRKFLQMICLSPSWSLSPHPPILSPRSRVILHRRFQPSVHVQTVQCI